MIYPWNDNIKVEVTNADEFGFGADAKGVETGIVVAIPTPDDLVSYGMHNFAFESSWMNEEKLTTFHKKLQSMVGKRIWWEPYQDRGRRIRITEDDKNIDYVFLKMSDILCYSDDVNVDTRIVEDERSGSFKI